MIDEIFSKKKYGVVKSLIPPRLNSTRFYGKNENDGFGIYWSNLYAIRQKKRICSRKDQTKPLETFNGACCFKKWYSLYKQWEGMINHCLLLNGTTTDQSCDQVIINWEQKDKRVTKQT